MNSFEFRLFDFKTRIWIRKLSNFKIKQGKRHIFWQFWPNLTIKSCRIQILTLNSTFKVKFRIILSRIRNSSEPKWQFLHPHPGPLLPVNFVTFFCTHLGPCDRRETFFLTKQVLNTNCKTDQVYATFPSKNIQLKKLGNMSLENTFPSPFQD